MAAPGFEILFCSVRDQLVSTQDTLVALFHWQFISKGFKCLGNGEKAGENEKLSELLPGGWNASQDIYTLRYTKDGRVFMLKAILMDGELLIHVMDVQDSQVANITVKVEDYTTGDLSASDSAYKNVGQLCSNFNKEVFESLNKGDNPTTTEPSRSRRPERTQDADDPLRVPSHHRPPDWNPEQDPFSVGHGDLDPFGRSQGGMVFDPLRAMRPGRGPDPNAGLPGRLPPGAIPPGARFDPYGPPGQRPGPDPDHLPPPGYDDMFM